MEILNIDKEKAINAYKQGSKKEKKVLELLFGVETFRQKSIFERVKTLSDALKELGKDHPLVKEYNVINNNKTTYNMKHYSQLCVITAALNEGWYPKFVEGEKRYFPYFRLYSSEEISQMSKEEKSRVVCRSNYSAYADGGVSYADANYDSANVNANIGSRLAFKTSELAKYAGKQFGKLYANYLGI